MAMAFAQAHEVRHHRMAAVWTKVLVTFLELCRFALPQQEAGARGKDAAGHHMGETERGIPYRVAVLGVGCVVVIAQNALSDSVVRQTLLIARLGDSLIGYAEV